MPLVHSEFIQGNTTLFIWKLEESEDELYELLGGEFNLDDLSAISHSDKRREWLASRLLIRKLVDKLEVAYHGTHKDEHGKAFLVNHDYHISLTHTLEYVAAIINPAAAVGIDMEKESEKLQRVAHKFLSPRELERTGSDIHLLCIYWCVKEAVYKQYGKKKISFKDSIFVNPFDSESDQLTATLTDEDHIMNCNVVIRWIDQHCLAISV